MTEAARNTEEEFDESRYLEFLTPEGTPLSEEVKAPEPLAPSEEDISDEEALLEAGISEEDLEQPTGLLGRIKGLFA